VEVVHLLGLEVTPLLSTLTSGELQHDRYRLSGLSRLVGGSHLSGIPELQRASTHLYMRISTEPMSTAGLHSDLRESVDLRL
jgi:actin-like ATPase involved in cell morphogenesis